MKRRNTVYAQTDYTPLRRVLELTDDTKLAEWLQTPDALISEEWHSPAEGMFRDLSASERFHANLQLIAIRQAVW